MTDAVTASTTSSTAATTSQSSAADSTATASALSSDFETFLKMLTAQMQNQDPLNPIESTDYAVQLATFSSVEQQVLTNDLLKDLGTQIGGNSLAEYAGWVGMQAGTNEAAYFDNTPIELLPTPATGADSMTIKIKDAAGDVVQSIQMDPTNDVLAWGGSGDDGTPFDPGFYSFELESYQGGALMGTSKIQTYSPIIEARADVSGTTFILKGGTEVSANDIQALRDGI